MAFRTHRAIEGPLLRVLHAAPLAMVATLVLSAPIACVTAPDLGNSSGTAMGSWPEWLRLNPLIEVAEGHVDRATLGALKDAAKQMAKGHARDADQILAKSSEGPGRHWISVARANLAALSFTTCIRGVAWRLPNGEEEAPVRSVDFEATTRIEPGDISVESMLTNLDTAIASSAKESPLVVQARIARARATAFVASCAPNEDVASRARGILNSDLASLASRAHLTPDLAYIWAGVQMNAYSGTAARPFLLQAQAGGFDDPSVVYMLALIALEAREFGTADTLAEQASRRYAELGDKNQQAQSLFVRGEASRQSDDPATATTHYESALALVPNHVVAMIGLLRLKHDHNRIDALELLQQNIKTLLGSQTLADDNALQISEELEFFVINLNEELFLAELAREALVLEIERETDPIRRGLRYFYAATLDARLGDYAAAQGHAAMAEVEFSESPIKAPVDPRLFLDRLAEANATSRSW